MEPHTNGDLIKKSSQSRRGDMLINIGMQIIGHLEEVCIKENREKRIELFLRVMGGCTYRYTNRGVTVLKKRFSLNV